MEITVKQIEKFKFNVHARSHSLICDQPLENGGDDSGMTPPELLLASLGACAEFYAAQYLGTRKLEDRGVEVTVTAEKLLQPARLGNFSHSGHLSRSAEHRTDGGSAALGSSLPDRQYAALGSERRNRILNWCPRRSAEQAVGKDRAVCRGNVLIPPWPILRALG